MGELTTNFASYGITSTAILCPGTISAATCPTIVPQVLPDPGPPTHSLDFRSYNPSRFFNTGSREKAEALATIAPTKGGVVRGPVMRSQ